MKIDATRGLQLLGNPIDVFLNEDNYWRGVPEQVWEYYIGGYQVLKKWLSYRDESVLGRALNKDEAREVTSIIRHLMVLVLIGDELDANYKLARDNSYSPWERQP